MTDRKPAVVYPPGTYVLEEMAERGWDFERLCAECGRGNGEWLPEYICGETGVSPHVTKSVSRGLARAFGTSAELWLNLDRAWQDHIRDVTKMVGGSA